MEVPQYPGEAGSRKDPLATKQKLKWELEASGNYRTRKRTRRMDHLLVNPGHPACKRLTYCCQSRAQLPLPLAPAAEVARVSGAGQHDRRGLSEPASQRSWQPLFRKLDTAHIFQCWMTGGISGMWQELWKRGCSCRSHS